MQNQDQVLLAALLRTAVDAIIVINDRGIMQSVNPATTKLFGYDEAEMVGENVKLLMPSPYRDEHDGYLRSYHETGRAKIIGIGREVTGKRKDETTFPMHLAVSEVPLGDKKLFAGIVRDISDLKNAQQQLSEINDQLEHRVRKRTSELHAAQAELLKAGKLATLGQVSGGIAHEIRNPLNAVRTSAYYLRNARNLTPAKTLEHLDRIDRQVSLIEKVITALSDFVRLPEPRLTKCNVNELIADVIADVSVPDSVSVQIQVATDLPIAMVDPNQISIVLHNLLRNAADAMPDGGTITLASNVTDTEVVVEVIDTGVGIEDEHIRRITEPLYSTKAQGMGLGLAVSAAILDKNHGHLEVESQLGVGTTFAVHLPRHFRA
ncbi:PAS/PAC sensor signal transduction histidine kinase [Rhodopirellula maiorica SM1]|uniref:Sensor protein FixL n=1 Tax=Rhodopirellula maiorica SM1 TaxID=1265738 RepID=M5RM97_9BACT|nr:PAS domain S-box protein [Rhodopirellula maiorica]EMI16517.1 PAS/PAC sensor signal transduction histidine kinase [Rhodopirellula maiorica SM1]